MTRRLTVAAVTGALTGAFLLPAPALAVDPPAALIEDFEDADVAYTTSTPEFSDGFGDFFTRTDGSNVGSFIVVQGQEGSSWFHGMDLDGEGATLPLTMTFADIDVSAFDSLAVELLVAEDDDGANQDWDAGDGVRIEASLDGGPLTPVLCFANDGAEFNTAPLADADCDGTGEGTEVTDTFATFAGAVDGTGSTLDIVITWDLNAGDEDLAIDQVRVTTDDGGGGDPPEPEPVCDTPDEELTLISDVQGSNADPDARFDSPLDGQTVTIRAVVTLADPDLGGYFVQEEPADRDGDPSSSEGLFVFQSAGDLPIEGQTVELTDEVTAFFGLTQLSFPDTEICDVPLVTIEPTPVQLPLDRDGREALEGMLVTNAQDLVVGGLFTAYRFGELGLQLDGPLPQPTSVYAPGTSEVGALTALNADSELKVNDRDEAFSQFNPFPWELFDEDLSAGDTMPAGRLVGALGYSFGEYKVEPLDNEVGDPSNRIFFPETDDTFPVPAAPALADGNDIVAFNVLNYFNTFGDTDELRGARSQEEFDTQSAKIVDAILQMDAAVYGLIELENDYEEFYDDDPTTVPAIVTLVEQLNAVAGEGTFALVQPEQGQLTDEGFGGLGPDAIAQGFIYQPARAEPVGPARTFDIDALLSGDADNNRWPLAQTFKLDKEFVEVVVNHFKSKGSTCTDTAGPGFGLGDDAFSADTANCNLTREYAAQRLVEWVEAEGTGFPTDDVALIGDFNSYEEEEPIEILVEAGYVDLVQELGDDAFTYKFSGRYGRLDYAFANESLAAKVTDTEVWQVNSTAPVGYVYFNDPIDDTAQASSDHDPVIVSIVSDGRNGTSGNGRTGGR